MELRFNYLEMEILKETYCLFSVLSPLGYCYLALISIFSRIFKGQTTQNKIGARIKNRFTGSSQKIQLEGKMVNS